MHCSFCLYNSLKREQYVLVTVGELMRDAGCNYLENLIGDRQEYCENKTHGFVDEYPELFFHQPPELERI